MATTVHTYTENLITNLRERAGLENVIIVDGPPELAEVNLGEWIAFLDVEGEQNWGPIGNRAKDEVVIIDMMIEVIAPGTNIQSAVNARAIEMFQEIEDELRTNPTQGVAGARITSQVGKAFRMFKRANVAEGWRECLIISGIELTARI